MSSTEAAPISTVMQSPGPGTSGSTAVPVTIEARPPATTPADTAAKEDA